MTNVHPVDVESRERQYVSIDLLQSDARFDNFGYRWTRLRNNGELMSLATWRTVMLWAYALVPSAAFSPNRISLQRPATASFPAQRLVLPTCCQRPEPKEVKPAEIIGRVFGFAYLGNVVVTVGLGILSRMGLVALPPVNTLTDIANNAMDLEIAAGTLQPLLATAWSVGFWLELLRAYYAQAGDRAAFLGDYCAAHASLCVGVVY